jgi:hypothetical protein
LQLFLMRNMSMSSHSNKSQSEFMQRQQKLQGRHIENCFSQSSIRHDVQVQIVDYVMTLLISLVPFPFFVRSRQTSEFNCFITEFKVSPLKFTSRCEEQSSSPLIISAIIAQVESASLIVLRTQAQASS